MDTLIEDHLGRRQAPDHACERGLDFADAGLVFAGRTMTMPDERRDYGEPRFITVGWLRDRFVAVVWTPREDGRRIISMRYGHGDEEKYWREQMD